MRERIPYRVVALLALWITGLCGSGCVALAYDKDTTEVLPVRVLPIQTDSVLPLQTDSLTPMQMDTVLTDMPSDVGRIPKSRLRRERGAAVTPDSSAVLYTDSSTVLYADSLQRAVEDSLELARHNEWRPNSIRAMWLGMVFPGGGQIYNRKFWKLPFIYGGVLGCIYAVTWNGQMLRDYAQAYQDIMDSDPTTNSHLEMLPMGYDITGREEHFKSVFKRKKDFYRRYRDLSILCIAGVYLLSIIDAYVDAELSTFDIGTDLSLNVSPTMIPSGTRYMPGPIGSSPGITLQLNY